MLEQDLQSVDIESKPAKFKITVNEVYLPMVNICLDQYSTGTYTPGASMIKQLLWFYLGDFLVQTPLLPFSGIKAAILRGFGAHIGRGVRIKPHVKIKFPWRLSVGDHTWLGEGLWIDNLADVVIEEQVCLSQGVYLCTGNHDWSQPTFDLRVSSIHIKKGSWIAAKAVIGPGVTIGEGAILALGGVTSQSLKPWIIYSGNPAQAIKLRSLKPEVSSLELLVSMVDSPYPPLARGELDLNLSLKGEIWIQSPP